MQFSLAACLTGLVALAVAQTPEGFTPNVTATLDVTFGTKKITPGMAMTKEETATAPSIGTASPLNGTHLLLVVDISVPNSFDKGNYEPRRRLLHALITNYTSAAEAVNGSYPLTTPNPAAPAYYMGPSPPPEDPPKAHNYVELLYAQPTGFDVSDTDWSGFSARLPFNLTAFVDDNQLAEPVAANYFSVTGAPP